MGVGEKTEQKPDPRCLNRSRTGHNSAEPGETWANWPNPCYWPSSGHSCAATRPAGGGGVPACSTCTPRALPLGSQRAPATCPQRQSFPACVAHPRRESEALTCRWRVGAWPALAPSVRAPNTLHRCWSPVSAWHMGASVRVLGKVG
jgi:hypothetical protein